MTTSDYFPNGIPKLITSYEWDPDDPNIWIVRNQAGVMEPIFVNYHLMVDTKKIGNFILVYEHMTPETMFQYDGPLKWESSSDYYYSMEEVMAAAYAEQARLIDWEQQYVPIYHRD